MKIRLATQKDDSQLRDLLRNTTIPGHIKMVYTREPSFFASLTDTEENTQVIVAANDERIEGLGCRSLRELFVNGKPRELGYLSGLRLSPSAQNSNILARGYSFIKKLHQENPVAAYLTTIIKGNDRATQVLTSGRAGLPSYLPRGDFLTHVIPVRSRSGKLPPVGPFEVLRSSQIPDRTLLDFLTQEGAKRNFFPVCEGKTGQMLLDNIGRENLLVAMKNNKIVGTMALWDQRGNKQHIVAGYSRSFGTLRPLINLGLRLRYRYALPSPGEEIFCGNVALVCISDDDSEVFQILLRQLMAMASSTGLHQVALGLHERDPLLPELKRFFHVVYRSSLYLVHWDNAGFVADLDEQMVPYLELGML